MDIQELDKWVIQKELRAKQGDLTAADAGLNELCLNHTGIYSLTPGSIMPAAAAVS